MAVKWQGLVVYRWVAGCSRAPPCSHIGRRRVEGHVRGSRPHSYFTPSHQAGAKLAVRAECAVREIAAVLHTGCVASGVRLCLNCGL